MKKSLIAGAGVAALGMAALPFAGVFAADETLSQTDTVVVTVDTACSLSRTGAGTYSPATSVVGGQNSGDIEGSTFTIACNDTTGWKLSAAGAATEADGTTPYSDVTVMVASTGVSNDDIPTGTTLDGSVSNWAFKITKVAGGGNSAVVGDYGDYSAVPGSTGAKIASGTSTASTQFTSSYKVGITTTQSAGTYTGKVTYTLAKGQS